MDADVRASNAALDPNLWSRRCGEANLRVNGVRQRRGCADGGEPHRVLSRVAALHVSRAGAGIGGRPVMLVGCQPVVVLRMIVAVVDVGVQPGHHA